MAGHKPGKTNKASELIGMSVRNPQDEELGTIKDIVIDFEQGRVVYAVLAAGSGLLGLGEKLVAVPINILRAEGEADYLTLNASKARLDAAKGFDSENYPAMQPSAWGAESFWNVEGTETRDRLPAGERPPDVNRLPGQPGEEDPQPQSPPNQE
jgi:sporulation protein YlmC with PRC-barrel domain